ncbi:uncharacterized protein LOC126810255 [Patella vulgata]|uniref:uncharacterized protein LOC126810255 n=1 Tax=Patella vulgata TaxID=6465 RepID=UPI00217F5CA3|nr:uncharacterized protein LOC126810255 [Patella vulgata]XP_050391226.1 uncharacterized protein LOC126810255 [Patella vulgata]XP_050391227.1 uncharacterized protein LOC126810255 [Patella vulgata]
MFINFPEQVAFVFLIVTIADIVADSISSVACYGSSGLSCTQHQLRCSKRETISIINITHGFRQGCGVHGVSSCADIACCREEAGDCYQPMTKTFLQDQCLNKSTCQTQLVQVSATVCEGQHFSTYSKIIYLCIPANKPASGLTTVFSFPKTSATTSTSSPKILPTTDTTSIIDTTKTMIAPTPDTIPKTDTPDIGSIVGGLIGALFVLALIVLIGIFLFKRKQRKCRNAQTCVYNNQNESLDVNLRENTNTDYDYITTEDVGKQGPQVYNDNYVEPNITVTSDDHYQQATKHSDNYNHIGSNTSVPYDGNYQHLRGDNSDNIKTTNDTYNHIRSFNHHNPGDDTYNHLGSEPKTIITDSEYNHIGSINHELKDSDYQHLGVVRRPSVVTDSEYSHIATVHKQVPDVDEDFK